MARPLVAMRAESGSGGSWMWDTSVWVRIARRHVAPGEQLEIHDRAERVEVAPSVGRFAAACLRGHIRGRSEYPLPARDRRALTPLDDLGDPEVEELQEVAITGDTGDKEVRLLDVAMDDSGVVRLGEGFHTLGSREADRERGVHRQPPTLTSLSSSIPQVAPSR